MKNLNPNQSLTKEDQKFENEGNSFRSSASTFRNG